MCSECIYIVTDIVFKYIVRILISVIVDILLQK